MSKARIQKVLIVDDDEINNFVCEKVINNSGMAGEAVSVKSGPDALEYLSQCTKEVGKAIPDLVLLDINMPYMDGWEFLEKFKSLADDFNQSPLIVMLSSSVYEADAERAHANPEIRDYITKPLTIDGFQNLVERLF